MRAIKALGHGGLGVFQVGKGLFRRKRLLLAAAAHGVDGGVPADENEPGRGIARRPVAGPGPQGPQARFLERFLGDVEVAKIAQQGTDGLRPGGGKGRVDPGHIRPGHVCPGHVFPCPVSGPAHPAAAPAKGSPPGLNRRSA
jgi:hypothetical protein